MSRAQTEADTCKEFVVPRLEEAGWYRAPHEVVEQYPFTDGRVLLTGRGPKREKRKVADYLLRVGSDVPLAVVEAKRARKNMNDGMQQAMEYATILGLPFAYATNGREIVEHDFQTGEERPVDAFPTPGALWARYLSARGLSEVEGARVLMPGRRSDEPLRYYQTAAVQRAFEALVRGDRRVLLTLATGTGKTKLAFQLCWRLWQAEWTRTGEARKPRMLFLSDRSVLVDEPHAKDFAPFEHARERIGGGGRIRRSREMYFATYQALTEGDPPRYRSLPPDFFDLVVVDECHRGSARADSLWREILAYFAPAAQVGMTATPLREESRDTYAYFGAPVYQYTLKQGVADGFLAPYRVLRVRTAWDAAGWRPDPGTLDRYGREIPDEEYQTKDFERIVALRARTQAIARHLTDYLKKTDRFAKTIVFCVDQAHAAEMRRALVNLNADLTVRHPDYAVRITADEAERGKEALSRFSDVDRKTPVIVTTSQLLTTGVDVPTCRNVVLARVVGSAAEFKQIVGRGTRLRTDYRKWFFTVVDYTGSATVHFADPGFDGYPLGDNEEGMDEEGVARPIEEVVPPGEAPSVIGEHALAGPGTLYYDGDDDVPIADERLLERGADGVLRTVRLTDLAREGVRSLYRSPDGLRDGWTGEREGVMTALAERGVDLDALLEDAGRPDADPFDLLCHLAFDAPLRTRRERAAALRRTRPDFFTRYGPPARAVLNDLLDRYAAFPAAHPFALPDALKVPELSARHGAPAVIAAAFDGPDRLRSAVEEMERLLYTS